MQLFPARISTLFLITSLLILTSLFTPSLFANEASPTEEKIVSATPLPKRYNFSVCAIFKNEATYLREWLEYNLLIGVDHIYLYNNGSTDDSLIVLEPYVKNGTVTVI